MGSEQQGPAEIVPHGNVDEVHAENKEVLVGEEAAAAAVVIVPAVTTEQPLEEKAATQATASEQNASPGSERKVSTEDPIAIIESLRARLLAERNSSKAAKQQSQQLAKKVKELERSLRAEIQQRKRCDEIIQELLAKLQEAGVKVDPTTAEKSEEQEQTRHLRPNWISNSISRRHSSDGNVEGDILHAHLENNGSGDQDSTSPQSPSGSSDTGVAATRRIGRSCRTFRRKETSELEIDEQVKGTWTKVGADVLELAKLRSGEAFATESGWVSRMIDMLESKNEGSWSTEHEDKGETEGVPASNSDEAEGSVDTEASTTNNREGLEGNLIESQAGHDSDQSGASSQHENDSNPTSTQEEEVKRVPESPVFIQMEAIKAKEGRSSEAACISSGEAAATERGLETSSTVQGNNHCEASGIGREETANLSSIHTSGTGEIRNAQGDYRVQNQGEFDNRMQERNSRLLQIEEMANRKAYGFDNGYNPVAPERDSCVPEGPAGYQTLHARVSGQQQQQQLRKIEPVNMTGYESPARIGQNNFTGGYHQEQTSNSNTRAYTAGQGYQNIDPRYAEAAWTEQNQQRIGPWNNSSGIRPPTTSTDNVEDILRALRIAKQQLRDAADLKQVQGNYQGHDIRRAPARGGGADWQQRYDNNSFAPGSLVSKASLFSDRPFAVPWSEPLPQMPNPLSAPAGYVDRVSIAKDLRYLSPHQF